MPTPRNPNSSGSIKVFISHAHDDRLAANQLIDFLLTEFDLSSHEIRCTSAAKAANRLETGKSIAEQLRKDLSQAKLVIGLLSYFGLKSVWVKFELGAAWGKRKPLMPIIGPDLKDDLDQLGPLGSDFHLSVEESSFETTLLSHFRQEMKRLEIGSQNNPSSEAKLALFVQTYRQYGGINADFSNTKVKVISPQPSETIGGDISVKFKVENMPPDAHLWFGVFIDGKSGGFWPKEVNDDDEKTVILKEGGANHKATINIRVVGVGTAGNAFIERWKAHGKKYQSYPPLFTEEKIDNAEQIPGGRDLYTVKDLIVDNSKFT